MTQYGKILAAAFSLFGLVMVTARGAEGGGQHPETFEKQVPVRFDYLLFLPQDYGKDQSKKWPLIVFLHGSGERGTDVNLVKKHGPPKIVENKQDFPFVVVSPQCPPGKSWNPFELNALLDDVLAKYRVDKDRVYLTGLSLGGFGTWAWAMQSADRFAAIAPICGGGDPTMVRRLRDMPVWVFHGGADPTVPVERSRTLVEALKEAGNTKVKYTEYPGVGHDSWTRSYDNPELYDWFLSHKRSDRPAGEGEKGKRRGKTAESKKG